MNDLSELIAGDLMAQNMLDVPVDVAARVIAAALDRARRDVDRLVEALREALIAGDLMAQNMLDVPVDVAARVIAAALDRARRDVDRLVEALREAQNYIRSQQPIWAKAEDLPPVMHKIGAALAPFTPEPKKEKPNERS